MTRSPRPFRKTALTCPTRATAKFGRGGIAPEWISSASPVSDSAPTRTITRIRPKVDAR
jgi:hypothetical protein